MSRNMQKCMAEADFRFEMDFLLIVPKVEFCKVVKVQNRIIVKNWKRVRGSAAAVCDFTRGGGKSPPFWLMSMHVFCCCKNDEIAH